MAAQKPAGASDGAARQQSARSLADISLGGRSFAVINFERRTMYLHCYLDALISQIGVDKVVPFEGESDAGFLVRLQAHITQSGRLPELLGGYLLPLGKTEHDWTPQMGAETARHIGLLDTAADRETALMLAQEVAFGFFLQWLDWLKRSPSSSQSIEPMSLKPQASPPSPEAASTSAIGTA